MKTQLAIMICCTAFPCILHGAWTEEDRRIEAAQAAIWENKLAESKLNPQATRPLQLWLGLRNMGYRKSHEGHSPAVDEIYEKLQTELLSIPGHAELIGRRIHEAYEPLKGPNPATAINAAQNGMMYGFATLKHLPSPENVKVLGEMLSETWEMPPTGDYTPPALAEPAMTTLGELGIRNAPWRPIVTTDDLPGALPAWQAWYEEVTTGRRTFSFKGQKVEYRFKPDGTWETIPIANPPDDGPKVPKLAPAAPTGKVSTTQPASTRSWLWVVGTVVLMLFGLFRIGSKRMGKNP